MAFIDDHQGVNGEEARAALNEWKGEVLTKQNSIEFGLTFRSRNNPTNFSELYSSRGRLEEDGEGHRDDLENTEEVKNLFSNICSS